MPLLHWLTRDQDIHCAAQAPYRLLEEAPELSYGDQDTGNMLIQGDNLDTLKALLPYYAGKVKCIYIDPPYNTKSAFEHYDDNLEHTQWLAMMCPRLELLRTLLAEDGSIWVSIDDNESHYLKVIMDEIFGRSNFIANVISFRKTPGFAGGLSEFDISWSMLFCIFEFPRACTQENVEYSRARHWSASPVVESTTSLDLIISRCEHATMTD
jgi:hypothetical protein